MAKARILLILLIFIMSAIGEFIGIVKELSDIELLDGVRGQLNNSINHLNESILLMYKEKLLITKNLDNENHEVKKDLQDDLRLYDELILENKKVLKKNFQKLSMVNAEIRKRSLTINTTAEPFQLKSLKEICRANPLDLILLQKDEDLIAINVDVQLKDSETEYPKFNPGSDSESEKSEDGIYL